MSFRHRRSAGRHALDAPLHPRMRAQLGADVLAASPHAIEVDESGGLRARRLDDVDLHGDAAASARMGSAAAARPQGCYLSKELGDGPWPDADWTLELPCDEHADLKSRIAYYAE